jgi:hypothetical protein
MDAFGEVVEWYQQGKLKYWEKSLYSVGDRRMDVCGTMVEWYWQGKTEIVGEIIIQYVW